jgi:outer membrane biosynthesis protein TonB
MVSDAIGSRWYFYVRQQMSVLVPGTVEIRFTVNSQGKASQIKVLRNSSNESFAACSVGSIVDAEIPPIPPEILPMLEGGRLEIDFTFAIY